MHRKGAITEETPPHAFTNCISDNRPSPESKGEGGAVSPSYLATTKLSGGRIRASWMKM